MDRQGLDQLVQSVFAKTGARIRTDDPILLNVAVIQTVLENEVAETRKLTEAVVGDNLVKFDASVQDYKAELERISKSYVANTERFLECFEDTVQHLNDKEAMTVSKSYAKFEKTAKSMATVVICCAIFNALALLVVLSKLL